MDKEVARGSMEKEAAQGGSGIERQPGQAAGVEKDTPPSSGATAAPPRRKKDWTPEERKAADEFMKAAIADYHVYAAMTEEDVEEEYRRAGKLHKYDAETELQKRCARVAKKHPPPAGFYPELEEYYKPFEEDED